MVRQIVRDYPDLGSFWYGHWEDVELTPASFLIIAGMIFLFLLALVLGGIAGYVFGAIGVSKIAKKQGAWRNIRIMACFPFVRYFAVGKTAERCDVLQNAENRRLWGRRLLICSCILVPVAVIALIIAIVGIPGAQLFVMIAEDGGSFLWDCDVKLVNVVMLILYVLLVVIALPVILLALVAEEMFSLVFVLAPFAGILGLLVGIALVAIIRTQSGKCYYKMLRTVYAEKTAMILTVAGALTGLSPFVLFAASVKKK